MKNYDLAREVINEARKNVMPYINVLKNINYKQVCTGDNAFKHESLYRLKYSYYFGFANTITEYTLFSKDKAEKIIKLFEITTRKLQEEIQKSIERRSLTGENLECVRNYTKHVGYCFDKLEELEDWHKRYTIERPPVPKNRRKNIDEDDYYGYEEEDYEEVCSVCRGGGCRHCEPSFFC